MRAPAGREMSEELFLDLVAKLCSVSDGPLTPVEASLLLALDLGICSDSRAFSRIFGIAHALVLREVTELAGDRGLLHIVARNVRSQRTVMALTDKSTALLARIG